MKLTIEEVVENVKEELLCYEGMEDRLDEWEQGFHAWVKRRNGKDKCLVEEKGQLYLKISDEGEIMEMADSYVDAIEAGDIKKYWYDF